MDELQAREVVDGQIAVTTSSGTEHRVLIPAGVGVPGVDDATLALTLVVVLRERGAGLPQVLDASQQFARDPGLLATVAERIERG